MLSFFNHLEEVELLEVVAEEKPGGALLRHRARAADVQVPQEAAVLTDLGVIYQPRYFSAFLTTVRVSLVQSLPKEREVRLVRQRREKKPRWRTCWVIYQRSLPLGGRCQ